MWRVTFSPNAKEIEADLLKINLDVEKAVQWYINQVYRDLSRQHGRRYTYATPPSPNRTNVRKRSGRLLNDLKESKYINKRSDNLWEAGFKINPGSYLARFHVGEPGQEQRFKAGDLPHSSRYKGRYQKYNGWIVIPLRAALHSDGTPKVVSGRHNLKVKRFSVLSNWNNADFSGEDKAKFHDNSLILYKTSGRKNIPMYVLARQITVPKRIFIQEKMIKYYDDLYDRLDSMIEKELNRSS